MSSSPDPVDFPAFSRLACDLTARVPDGERIYAIGDIHGRLDLLAALVARIRCDNDARGAARVRLVLLGDLIDRGLHSAQIVNRCRALAARSAALVVLKGNHEAMMVDGVRGNLNAFALWLRHGGDAALRSWGVSQGAVDAGASPGLIAEAKRRVPAGVIDWLDALPESHVAGDYLFVHAGIRPDVALNDQSPQDMLWIRREFLDSDADHGVMVVHGHSIDESGVVSRPNRIGIDTGAYRSDVLTALALESNRRWTLSTDAGDATAVERAGVAGQLEVDVAAILKIDAAEGGAPVMVRWPRVAVPAVLGIAASVLALVLARSPEAPPPHRVVPIAQPPVAPTIRADPGPAIPPRQVAVATPVPRSAEPVRAETAPPPRNVALAAIPRPARAAPVVKRSAPATPPVARRASLKPAPPPRPEPRPAPATLPDNPQIALAAERPAAIAPPPPPRAAEDAAVIERLRVQRSLDAIRALRRQ